MKNNIDVQDNEMLSSLSLPYDELKNKTIMITGANGLIGSAMVDAIMNAERFKELNVSVIAVSRSLSKAKAKFSDYMKSDRFTLIVQDVCDVFSLESEVAYIMHAASPSHPVAYAKYPVDVIKANILGTLNMLDLAHNKKARLIYISSGEVYGSRSEDNDGIAENYLGNLDFMDPRSCYPEAKRASENLCVCYKSQYDVDVVIARLCHIYGPGISDDNTRADAQFLRNALNRDNIILKSSGSQKRSYCYISDCISGLLHIILLGGNGEAYNIANKNSTISIKEYAQTLANLADVSVVFDLPAETEVRGYSKNPNAILDASKLEGLGWNANFGIKEGLEKTFRSIRKA